MPHPTQPMVTLFSSLMAHHRHRSLRRHWRVLQASITAYADPTKRALAGYVHDEARRARNFPLPQFYAASQIDPYAPWGDAAHRSFTAAQSADLNTALRGAALWLVAVHGETASVRHRGLQALHEEIKPLYTTLYALHERALAIRRAHLAERADAPAAAVPQVAARSAAR